MPLTDTALRKLKPVDKPVKLADEGNLYLHLKPSGSKTWRMDYRFLELRKTLTFGPYPAISLAEARELRNNAKSLLAKGIDPGAQKKFDKIAASVAQGNTFGVVADEFLEKMKADGRASPTIAKNKWMIKELAGSLARRPISEISPVEILTVLKQIERTGRTETALATRSAIGRVFRYAIASARAEQDPTFPLRGALQRHIVVSHPALVSPDGVRGLFRAIWAYEGWPSLGALLKVQALCFTRPGEARSMEWSELDLDGGVWTIPAHKAKMRRQHDVPLSRQSIAIIKSMSELRVKAHDYVFPSMMSGKSVLSENSMNSALRRMGFTKEEHTAHGFRSTASTILNESNKFDSDVIEAQLAHQERNKVRRIYNRAEYWDERVKMMQWWADFIESHLR